MPKVDPNKTVFISYRRSVHPHLSLMLFKDLKERDFDPFRDSDTMGAGEFEKIILNQIAARTHFVVLLSHGSLDRCVEPGDWLRREIEYAIELERNIVPLLIDGFKFEDAEAHLTGKLDKLKFFQGQPLYTEELELYEVGVEKLANQKLKLPSYLPPIQPIPPSDKAMVKQIIEDAIEAPKPTPEELNAEQVFVQALKKHEHGELLEALKDYNQIILLNPSHFEAHFNRGLIYATFHVESMLEDYNEALRIEPNNADAYNNRGVAKTSLGDLDDAILDYTVALRIKPNYLDAYNNRGRAYLKQGLYRKAIEDFSLGIEIAPHDLDLYEIRGQAYFSAKKYSQAIEDFTNVRRDNIIRSAALGGIAISYYRLGKVDFAKRQWKKLTERKERFKDVEWIRIKFNWEEPLVEAARELISELE